MATYSEYLERFRMMFDAEPDEVKRAINRHPKGRVAKCFGDQVRRALAADRKKQKSQNGN